MSKRDVHYKGVPTFQIGALAINIRQLRMLSVVLRIVASARQYGHVIFIIRIVFPLKHARYVESNWHGYQSIGACNTDNASKPFVLF